MSQGFVPTVSIYTAGSYDEHQRSLRQLAVTPGAARKLFLDAVVEAGDNDAVLRVRYGKAVATVNKTGALVDVSDADEVDVHALTNEADGVVGDAQDGGEGIVVVESFRKLYERSTISPLPRGAVPANKRIGSVLFPCGTNAIVGGSGKGKTPLAHALASAGGVSYAIVPVGEPMAGYISDDAYTAHLLCVAMLTSTDIVLDSIKDLLSSGGSLMKSGLSRDALLSISSWATAACEAGCTIHIPINPSQDDAEVMRLLTGAVQSNSTVTMEHKSGPEWGFQARTGEGLPRINGVITLDKDRLHVKTDRTSEEARSFAPLSANASPELLTAASRRSMIHFGE